MSQGQPHISLPLEDFIARLQAAGFAMDTRRKQRLLQLLELKGGQHIGRLSELKYSLAPFVASSAAEQVRFYDFFEAYLRECEQEAEAWAAKVKDEYSQPEQTEPSGQEIPSPRGNNTNRIALIALALIAVALLVYIFYPRPVLRILPPAALQVTPDNPYPSLREGNTYRFTGLPATADTAGYRWAVYDTLSRTRLQADSGRHFELQAVSYGSIQRLILSAADGRTDSLLLPPVHCARPPVMPDWQLSTEPGEVRRFAVVPTDTAVSVRWVFNRQDTLSGAAVSYPSAQAGNLVVECIIASNPADCYTREERIFGMMATAELLYDEQPAGWQQPYIWVWLLCLLPLLPAAARVLYRWRDPREKLQAGKREEVLAAEYPIRDQASCFIPYRSPYDRISCPPDFFRMAELLRRREEGERSELDVAASVQATVEGGGYPVLLDKLDTRPGDYLFLIEEASEQNQQSRLFERLGIFFIQQDAPVRIYFHRGTFNSFWNNDHPEGVSIAFLQKNYSNHRLVLIGTSHGLLDGRQSELGLQRSLLEPLRQWKQVLCLTPLPVSGWFAPEVLLHQHFLLYPADSAGIDAGLLALSELDSYEPGPYRLWERMLAERRSDRNPRFQLWETVEDHRNFLANDAEAFRWLCGLAVCVSPDFALTVAIGRKLGIEVTHDRLLRLSRIPWLSRNKPNDALRLALLRELSAEEEALAREAVAEELEVVRDRVQTSFAFTEWETSLAIQHFALSPTNKEKRQLLRDLLQLGLFTGSQQAELDGLVQRRLQPQAGEGYGIVEYLQQPEPRPLLTPALLLEETNEERALGGLDAIPKTNEQTMAERYVDKLAGTFVLVEGGSFDMGCTSEQQDCRINEKPVHRVTLSSYYIGQYAVTQAQWREVMGDDPPYFLDDDQYPVDEVSWENVQEFLQRLNARTGQQYRLPTEAEWEFAARGGTKSKGYQYAGSNNLEDVAWYYDNSEYVDYPVGQKLPNELGLYDMSGYVWEWCQDWYGDYSSSAQTNPTGPSTGSRRVVRGGSYVSVPAHCRVAYRCCDDPDFRYDIYGFRLARTP